MKAPRKDSGRIHVDIGDEAPLVTADNRTGPPDRRRVSLRWLSGTILAALASTSLMGGALFVAFDGRPLIAMPVAEAALPPPQPAEPAGEGDLVTKADRLEPGDAVPDGRTIVKVSTITREGDEDHIRMKPFARVSVPLVADTAAVVDAIPAYNPLRIFADANPDASGTEDVLYGVDVDGQMKVKVSEFPVASGDLPAKAPFDLTESERLVREAARFLAEQPVQMAALPLVDPARFDFGFAESDAFQRLGVRVIPENVSFVATTGLAEAGASGAYTEVKTHTAAKGEDFEQILTSNEATDEEAAEVAIQMAKSFQVDQVVEGDRLRIELAAAGDESGRYRPIRVSIYRDGAHLGTLALSDQMGYVASQEPRNEGDDLFAAAGDAAEDQTGGRPRLYESLYQTALSQGMSPALIDEMIRIFSFDLDFNTRIGPGDRLEVVYSLDENETETAEASEIIYTALTIGGKQRRFYRFKAPDDGSIDYYDEDGKSAKKFLLRKPMSGGTFRSGFGSRRHPLLGYVRAHTGVDWSAPRGTPIMAAGDGEVTYADWKSGYGNYIEIRHTNGYETAYAHQTGFAKGVKQGVRVRQGQVIGYVGSTGLSTGPHLHYEVHVNGNPVDPMRIKLPRGRTLEDEVLATFSSERERIDTLLGGGTPAVRQTAQAESTE